MYIYIYTGKLYAASDITTIAKRGSKAIWGVNPIITQPRMTLKYSKRVDRELAKRHTQVCGRIL